MQRLMQLAVLIAMMFSLSSAYAGFCGTQKCQACPRGCDVDVCCGQMGGIRYCDSSAGRYVCNNGYYSSCYCTRHAVMDLQDVNGCCLWQGGVLTVDPAGLVICNNGGVSELCSLQSSPEEVAAW
ncbi:neurogenic locus notch [Legionella spiritensis]|uniref:neurogenic locus notch n=1 Tax=Legionella spiritensis TaxID=452 RepID=UPI000F6DEC5A|nr:neurogenic locus notch [Legionella spiritensis]VEG89869.1 neurogenic locus notch like protein precursor [Legionella spiritensis]